MPAHSLCQTVITTFQRSHSLDYNLFRRKRLEDDWFSSRSYNAPQGEEYQTIAEDVMHLDYRLVLLATSKSNQEHHDSRNLCIQVYGLHDPYVSSNLFTQARNLPWRLPFLLMLFLRFPPRSPEMGVVGGPSR